ncbi:16S rRNA (cytosine(967)-C(5))-methyltransferase RsmB [Candidatus Methylopumilus turicensis]|uniref:16S rRNA (cytosine(967)-C(5))-methyltransferase n=1 Tax=Candidatus Methylopumilus turicensis TaxID=1581680 RepID=A0A0B7IS83_9PROT|nr:16S rRNA (cytosine(967)-C(5))-methyltransferase RsmB [Candidatus Methylopumilus turicensis]CEN55164.1 16S rRNA m5C967 methyltransferase, S-adenosyl-L-methionine-dependent [Candidatus Methylopumilus turicensis]
MHISQQIAAEAIGQVFAGRNLGVVLDGLFSRYSNITPQQRAVAQDLSYGTLRFYGAIQSLLDQLLQKPLDDARLQCLLLVAVYQLQYDKAASHTVVDQAVKAASQSKKTWAKGLVNGVLRNFLRQQAELLTNIQDDEFAKYSYPAWWITKLRYQYPNNWQEMLEAGNQHPPMILRVNQRQISSADFIAKLSAEGIASQALGANAVMLEKPIPVDLIPGFADGEASVQDYAAQVAGYALDLQSGQRVLDACCAPGGKTGQILELADVDLVAVDNDETRIARTQSNLERLKLKATLLVGDAGKSADWWDGKPFDRILADVPCTASGIVRRHVDIKWLRREADIASFTRQQAQILPSLWQLLAKGGKLLYVTCSVFQEENQRQIDSFLKLHADAEQLPLNEPISGLTLNDGQLKPGAQHDGLFYALLQKH